MKFFKVKLLLLAVLCYQYIFSQDSISIGLDTAIQLAIQKNTTIKISNYQINTSKFALKEAKANSLPKLYLNANYYRNIERQVIFLSDDFGLGKSATKLGADNEFRGSLNVSFPMYSKYNVANNKLVETQLNLQNELARGTQLTVINATKKTYTQYFIAQQIVKVQKSRLKNATDFLLDIKKRLQKGTLTEFDLTSAKVQVAIAKNNLLEAQSATLPIANSLKLLLGLDINAIIELTEPLVLMKDEVFFKAEIEQLLQNNSKLKQLETTIELNENQLQLVKSMYYPSIDIIGNYNYQSQANNFKFSEYNWVHTSLVGLQLQFSIFNGTVTKNKVQQVILGKKIAEEEKQYALKMYQLQLNELISQLEFTTLKVEVQQENLKLTAEALRLAKKRYQLGVATILEVNDAELAYTQAHLNLLQSIFDYKTRYYDYQLLIGKG